MEPKNQTLEKKIPFGNHHFQVPCLTSGVYTVKVCVHKLHVLSDGMLMISFYPKLMMIPITFVRKQLQSGKDQFLVQTNHICHLLNDKPGILC